MLDPGTILAIIQISGTVATLCTAYIQSARDAPSDLQAILIRVKTFQGIFESFKILGEKCEPTLSVDLVARCQKVVEELKDLIPELPPSSSSGQHASKRIRTDFCRYKAHLAWPFKAEKAAKLLREIDECVNAVNLCFSIQTTGAIEEIKRILSDSERREVYKWLVQVDPSPFHNHVQSLYEPYTGEWVLETQEWKDWVAGQAQCIWIHGIPGAGKTVLGSNLIEKVRKIGQGGRTACIYYYCVQRQQNDALPFLRWVLSQLCRQADQVPASVYEMFKSGTQPSIDDVLVGIEDALGKYKTVFIFLDAIDESNTWTDILYAVSSLATTRFPNLRLLATSREYQEIEMTMKAISRPISMDNPKVRDDISRWVMSKTAQDAAMSRWEPTLLGEVRQLLPVRAEGMFRWAVCQVDSLRRLKQDRSTIERALRNLPQTLEDIYIQIISLIPKEDWPILRHTLRWVYFHNAMIRGYPMGVDAVLDAFEHTESDLAAKARFYDSDSLKDICGCLIKTSLIKTYRPRIYTGSAEGLAFAHYTVREFLEGQKISAGPLSLFQLSDSSALLDVFQTVVSHVTAEHSGCQGAADETSDIVTDGLWGEPDVSASYSSAPEAALDWAQYLLVLTVLGLRNLPFDVVFAVFYKSSVQLLKLMEPWVGALGGTKQTGDGAIHTLENILHDYGQDLSFPIRRWIPGTSGHWSSVINLALAIENRTLHDIERILGHLWTAQDPGYKDVGFYLLDMEFFAYNKKKFQFMGCPLDVVSQTPALSKISIVFVQRGPRRSDLTSVLLSHIGTHVYFFDNKGHKGCSSCPTLCQSLVDANASVNGEGFQVSPLQMAVLNMDLDGARFLLSRGADANGTGDPNGRTWGESSPLRRFRALPGVPPLDCFRVQDRWSRLRRDLWRGKAGERPMALMINLLLRHGARVDDSHRRITLLQVAAYKLWTDTVELLLKAGSDPDGVGDPKGGDCAMSQHPAWRSLVGLSPLECCRVDKYDWEREGIVRLVALLKDWGATGVQDSTVTTSISEEE